MSVCVCDDGSASRLVEHMDSNTAMREGEEGVEEGGGGKKMRERGGTTGGTYCQVGPGGVARVAPLSDSTHKREVGKTLAVRIEIRRTGNERRRGDTRELDKAGNIYIFSLYFCFSLPIKKSDTSSSSVPHILPQYLLEELLCRKIKVPSFFMKYLVSKLSGRLQELTKKK